MSERNTVARSMHDIGLATWFGGSLMGAVGLNGATAEAIDPQERLRLSSKGWGRWTPVQVAAVGAHVIGGLGLIRGNKKRLNMQSEGRQNTVVKTGVLAAAMAVTAYSGYQGRIVSQLSEEGARGATEPSPTASPELTAAQNRLKMLQWAIPALTGVMVVMGAQQGEQQRPLAGLLKR